MALKIKPPVEPVETATPVNVNTVFGQLDPYVPGDAIPVPDVIEKNSESVWALWSDAVKDPLETDADAHPATQLMGLDELPRQADG